MAAYGDLNNPNVLKSIKSTKATPLVAGVAPVGQMMHTSGLFGDVPQDVETGEDQYKLGLCDGCYKCFQASSPSSSALLSSKVAAILRDVHAVLAITSVILLLIGCVNGFWEWTDLSDEENGPVHGHTYWAEAYIHFVLRLRDV